MAPASRDRLSALRRIGQRWVRAVYKHADRRSERRAWRQWFLLIGRYRAEDLHRPDPAALMPILPPSDRFWADPFLWVHEGSPYVFCEEYPRERALGRIAVLPLDTELTPQGPAIPVLDEDRHLSYPFLFEFEEQLYLVPESARSRRVDLYRCECFPDRWSWQKSLLTDIEAADATLLEHEGRWWLFCAVRRGRVRMNESLFAFYADSPLADRWVPHPGNPLVRDFSRGRPAGRILRDPAGRLLRPSQDCVPRYGYGLALNHIEALDTRHFHERRIWHATGPSVGGWRALHHLDWHQGILVMDAQRLLPKAEAGGGGG